MAEPGGDQRALPTDRAFVLQFRKQADPKTGKFDGRIEHMTSGEAALFNSLEELLTFLQKILPPGKAPAPEVTAEQAGPSESETGKVVRDE